jgi:manganese/zinc/iron transport system substrate-binding protein
MNVSRWFCLALLLGGISIFAGCGPGDGSSHAVSHTQATGPIVVEAKFAGQGPVKIVCTTGMVADVARNVGGKHVEVTHLMGEGVDPHLYKAAPGDVSLLNAADVIFYSGWHLEGKMAELFARLARRKPTFAIAEQIPAARILTAEGGAHDPHLWFDVALWSETANVARDVLAQFDPAHAEEYRQNATAYRQRLAQLDEYARSSIAKIPPQRRVLVTAHDAFRYFGRAYEIEVRGIQGISTDSEAGVRAINELVDFLVERKIKAVFIETSVSDQNIRSLLEGAKSRGHEVVIGGELFSDAMGRDGTPAGTYDGMIRHNVDTIVTALE